MSGNTESERADNLSGIIFPVHLSVLPFDINSRMYMLSIIDGEGVLFSLLFLVLAMCSGWQRWRAGVGAQLGAEIYVI